MKKIKRDRRKIINRFVAGGRVFFRKINLSHLHLLFIAWYFHMNLRFACAHSLETFTPRVMTNDWHLNDCSSESPVKCARREGTVSRERVGSVFFLISYQVQWCESRVNLRLAEANRLSPLVRREGLESFGDRGREKKSNQRDFDRRTKLSSIFHKTIDETGMWVDRLLWTTVAATLHCWYEMHLHCIIFRSDVRFIRSKSNNSTVPYFMLFRFTSILGAKMCRSLDGVTMIHFSMKVISRNTEREKASTAELTDSTINMNNKRGRRGEGLKCWLSSSSICMETRRYE